MKTSFTQFLVGGLAALATLAIVASIWLYSDLQEAQNNAASSAAVDNAAEFDNVISDLSAIMVLDEGDPVIAVIENLEAMRAENAEFYKNALAGDYMVLYPTKAIIYRASENKIVNVAPIINASAGNDPKATENDEESP